MSFTHASLFSGIGGFDLAAEWVGWKNVFHCEINEFCAQILKYHFPNADHYEDIKTTDFTKWRGKINVLSGGFPCQPFSLAGRRKGAEDDRYLWPQMLRAIQEIKPDWVVGENVAGIITMVQPGKAVELGRSATLFGEDYKDEEIQQQYVIETVCQDLEHSGYSIQPILIPACAVGAPHRRDRVWFIANRTDTGAESMQQAGQNSIHAVGFASNTCCIRRTGRRSKGYREEDKKRSGQVYSAKLRDLSVSNLLPTPRANKVNGINLNNPKIAQRNKGNLEESVAKIIQAIPYEDGKTSQLNPLFVAEMMGFPLMWTTLPYLSRSGERNQSRPTETP